ncbi:MAG TPA: hypothetical protein VEK15_27115 [Vicinamibacteria bacterium]|nr:hypothetical protein [Vicinamibacteria bacterium]
MRAGVLAAILGSLISTAPVLAKQSHLLLIAGLGGEPSYTERFHEWALAMRTAAIDRYGLSPDHVVYLGEDPTLAPDVIRAKSTRENIIGVFADLQRTVRPGDQIYIMLLGHGGFSGDQARFNLPGPDLTPDDFQGLLAPFTEQLVVFVNTTSASGDFLPALSSTSRVLVTATKTSHERNETQFGKFFVEAYSGDDADTDKNERVSVLEAFDYARQQVDRYYEENNLLKTEHPQLDDNGDGIGIGAPGEDEGDFAGTAYLIGASSEETAANPEVAELIRRREDLQGRVEALRLQKDSMAEELYNEELERLLLELARVVQTIEERSKP